MTGAGGFAGSHLVESLSGRFEVVAWSRSGRRPPNPGSATWQDVELLDADRVCKAIRELRPSAVYHCAGSPHLASSWNDSMTPWQGNVVATIHLLDALRRAERPSRVVITSSATVYAPSLSPLSEDAVVAPASPYARSKLAQEQIGIDAMGQHGVEVIIARPFNHTGPRQSEAFATPSMARQIALIERGAVEPIIQVGNLESTRDITDVRDIARAYQSLMARGTPGTIYNVASGVGRTIRSVLDGLLALARTPVRVEQDPARSRPHDIPLMVGDVERLHAATGWTPSISFEQTLQDTLDYWRSDVARA